MTVAYQGAEGAFSHEACLRFLPDHEPVPLTTFGEVVAAVQSGEADFGMLPLANNEAGETGARELIERAGLRIVELPVVVEERRPARTPISRRAARTLVGIVRLRRMLRREGI